MALAFARDQQPDQNALVFSSDTNFPLSIMVQNAAIKRQAAIL